MHRVLGISPDFAFCLHSKERVPYHIIIKVALESNGVAGSRSKRSGSHGDQNSQSYDSSNSSSSSSQYLAPGFLQVSDLDQDGFASDMASGKAIEMIERKRPDKLFKPQVSPKETNQLLLNSQSPSPTDFSSAEPSLASQNSLY